MSIGSYYNYPPALGRVDPGIDVSHWGAPYQGMLGLGGYAGLGTLYATAGLGTWTPGPGQTPADDPRMVNQFAKVRQTYRVRSVPSDKAGDAATAIMNAARTAFAPNRVRLASGDGYGNGWGPGGRVGVDVTLAAATRLGELKAAGKGLQNRNVISGVSPGATLIDARTGVDASQITAAPGVPAPPPGTPADADAPAPTTSPTEEGNFLTRKVGGVPVWAIGGLGLVAVGGLAFALTRKKKPAAVAKNRRRRRRRRRR